MKNYYAYLKNNLEKIDRCFSTSRLTAAQHFAKKKHINLKDYLNIYYVIDNDQICSYKNKTIRFQQLGFIVDYIIILKNNNLLLSRINLYGENKLFRKNFKLYKLPSLLKYVKDEDYFIISIID